MEGTAPGEDRVWLTPLRVTVLYFGFGTVWILLSDWSVAAVFGVSALTLQAQLVKGLLFVAGSGGFIYLLVVRRDRRIQAREATIRSDRSEIADLESEVEHSERLLELILSNITDTVLLTDEAGRFTYVCPNVHYIFGYSPDAVESMGTIEALLGDGFPPDGLEDDALVENIEHVVTDADGRDHTVLVTVKAVAIEAGSVLYSVRDISERRAQEERFRAYVEHASDVLTVIDGEGSVRYVSPSIERVFGLDPAAVEGTNAFEQIHPDDREAVRAAFRAIKHEPPDTTRSVQYRTRTAEGPWRWAESRLTTRGPDVDDEYVVNTHDISELREQEGRLSVLDRVLRHNLRNKLNLILGRARSLDTGDDPEAASAVEEIVAAGERLLSMSEKARRFDATLRPREAQIHTVDLADCVRNAVRAASIEHPGATVRADCPGEALVSAHEAIELAVSELVDNAVDHGGRPHPTVELTLTVNDDAVELSVADDGPGISELERRVLLEGEETPLEHGLGLGLWLVRWTVENSGGHMDVRDLEPAGTVVEVTLPRADPGDAPASRSAGAPRGWD